MKKIILHLCADLGSDSKYYQLDDDYHVIMVGESIGVENFIPPENVHGVIANPPCTEFSTAPGFNVDRKADTWLLWHCIKIIDECKPKWWAIENPANGTMKNIIGAPKAVYQPWQYGSPWTKKTALWGNFNMPFPLYSKWEDCPKNPALYVRPGRPKPALAFLHKSAVDLIPEMQWAKGKIKTDADIRSMCSDGFAKSFYLANK